MAKVIVERPRYGSSMRGPGKGYRRSMQRVPAEDQARREGMKRAVRSRSKSLNEHLGPLRRYLQKQVGRPWDKVFAEICAHISRDSAVQDHVRDHVFDFVAVRVTEIGGKLFHTTRWGYPVPLLDTWFRPLLYVCPKTGLLRRLKHKSRRNEKSRKQLPTLQIHVDFNASLVRKFGVWYHVQFEEFTKIWRNDFHALPSTAFDLLENANLSRDQAVQHYGRAVFAAKVRPATRDEIRRFAEPLKTPNRV